MSAGNSWTDVATAISGIVFAVVAAVAAGAAVYAAKLAKEASDSWRRGLEYQRIDEAISAVHEVHSRINGVLATMEASGQDVWDAYDDAWDSWSRFDQAYAVVRRYHGSLSDRADERFAEFLAELGDRCRTSYDPDAISKLKSNVNQLAQSTEHKLRALT